MVEGGESASLYNGWDWEIAATVATSKLYFFAFNVEDKYTLLML